MQIKTYLDGHNILTIHIIVPKHLIYFTIIITSH
jgi:hypothetical protein